MIALSAWLTVFSEPLFIVVLIALMIGSLEGERVWTRSRRGRRLAPGVVAYLLDGLVVVSAVLVLLGTVTLFVEGLTSIAATVGSVIDGERVGLLIVGMALAIGIAMALARAASGRRAAQELLAAKATVMPTFSPAALAAELRQSAALEQQAAYALSMRERFDEASLPPLAMMQERWQPGAASAASVPKSFLDLVEPPPSKPARSRFALASTLLTLALVVMLVSSAVLFRHQLMNILAGMDDSYGGAVTAGTNASPSSLDAGAENAAANVGAAASQPGAAAPAAEQPAGDAQASQKRVKSNGLNLRALPGTDQQVVAVLKQGDTVIISNDAHLIQGATWVKVRAGDFEGWVDQSLLE